MDILLIVPLPLLGLLFGKVILPALDEAGLRDKNAWAVDRRDFQAPSSSTSTTAGGSVGLLDLLLSETPAGGARHCRRQHLITAVGALGSQLGWPAWVDFYQRHRYVSNAAAAPVDVALPRSLEPRVVDTTITTEAKQTPPPSRETSPSREPMELPNAPSKEEETSIIQTGLTSNRREFVENLRRREYGRGVELDETANKLLQLYERRLSRSLAHLSQELYGQPGHFLLELIQNADDNTYADDRGSNNDGGSVPSIEFYLYTADDSTTTSASLFVRNNEAAGFSEADISALCDVGVSTKMAQRDQKTGEHEIPVLAINQPYSPSVLRPVRSSDYSDCKLFASNCRTY
ncbi:unnamed protein product [Dibothriocephalus latus]|uniref:Uncharacterized protein n=1 Tax=Dibothriocephalus latus TaxID=60516 RepID=A0A3P7M3K8_DIBLA|nr:unnamed protein product [Dibothriocephalus latus]